MSRALFERRESVIPVDRIPRDALGRYLPGAELAAWGKLAGSRPKVTAARYVSVIAGYIAEMVDEGRMPGLAGAAHALGISVQELIEVGEGVRGPKGEGARLCAAAYSQLRAAREAYLEERLPDRRYATHGITFALKATERERWGEAPRDDSASGEPRVAVAITVAGLAERVQVDVAPTGRTLTVEALADEARRIIDSGAEALRVDADDDGDAWD